MDNDPSFSWPLATMIIGLFFAIAIAVAVLIPQIFGTWRARMSIAREEAYKKLAEEAVGLQRDIAGMLEKSSSELAQIRERTEEMERLLKEVE